MKKTNAFTTPEVLLTLLIIGVVVSMTIIVLSQETSGREIILKVKKAYSVVANSYEQALSEYGSTYEWDSMSADSFAQKIGKKMTLAKACDAAQTLQKGNDCFPDCPKIYKAAGGSLDVCTSSSVATMMSADGFAYAFQVEDPICSVDVTGANESAPTNMRQVCGTFLVDIDSSTGKRNKNYYGRDLFLFYITREGMVPTGLDVDVKYPFVNGECKQKVYKDEFGCSALMVYGDNKLEK